jgi:RNA polymerase sigma-70 factor (ECF subfamily)
LITRAQQGDTAAFEALLARHRSLALRLAARVLGRTASPADAEDAVQDAFLSAWRRLPEFRGEASFSRWMCRIVTNRCLNLARSHRPTMPLEGVLDGAGEPAAASGQSPERRAEAGAALLALRAALAALTPSQRACWLLAELHGLSYQEIATVVRSTPQAVRGRIFRARRDLAAAMRAWR